MKTIHRLTWRGYCAFEVMAYSRADAISRAIAGRPANIPPGTGLFYGMAGGSNAGAVYVVPDAAQVGAQGMEDACGING